MKPNIGILMATYNGEKYIEKQIKSIFNQTYENWNLIIHDDGSEDETPNIIRRYSQDHHQKIIFIDDGLVFKDAKYNFSYLLGLANANFKFDYLMLCDQDDVWHEDKISKTLTKMKRFEKKFPNLPLLVHTDLRVVDKKLNLISNSLWKYEGIDPAKNSINRLIMQNTVTGCTMMMNRKLVEMSVPIPKEAIMHDWWIGLVASAFGRIDYINESTIDYRQHNMNDIGAKNFKKNIFKRIFYISKNGGLAIKHIKQAEAFLNRYRNLLQDKYVILLQEFVSLKNSSFFKKRQILLKYRIFKQGIARNMGLFLFI